MRQRLYELLVNRHTGIRERYHRCHDSARGGRKLLSWFYLLLLNAGYYLFFQRWLGESERSRPYEEKRLLLEESESAEAGKTHLPLEDFVQRLEQYDVVSFDIFDTLILRPVSEPTDLFYFLGERLGLPDFRRIRMEQEYLARQAQFRKHGTYEVTLADIWRQLQQETGLSARGGAEAEMRVELEFCYANPFMQEVYQRLRQAGKIILIASDMYLPETFLRELLRKNGYATPDKLYISCEYAKSKAQGDLYGQIRLDLEKAYPEKTWIHVGDNLQSDVHMAEHCGVPALYYPNVNRRSAAFRAYDMSPVIGAAYRGIVNGHLYNGLHTFSRNYEYGYIYGGIFVLGYCKFIHTYCRTHAMDKILFLSRDGDILIQAYRFLYPEDDVEYAYWSRAAAVKLMAPYNRYDYIRRFLMHRRNQGVRIGDALRDMELSELAERLEISAEEELTDQTAEKLKTALFRHWAEVLAVYEEENQAAKQYYEDILKGCRRAVAVDIGWAGSGALSLRYLAEHSWHLPCDLYGILAGTNTIHNAEPDAAEPFLQSGRLTAYLFSQAQNRDVMKRHDPGKNYNVYWELLLASPTPQLRGFGFDADGRAEPRFGRYDKNLTGIREIQAGILAFVREWRRHFQNVPYMERISGRDACAPMLLASCRREAYLKAVYKEFHLELSVGNETAETT